MLKEQRGVGRQLRGISLAATCVLLLPACAPVVGGGVLVGVVAIGALTSRCYDYLDVTVLDGQGRKTCAATVTATNGSSRFELGSCYYAPLTDGVWSLRATLHGERDASTSVPVDHRDGCTRHVQSVELTLSSPGTPVFAARVPTPPPRGAPIEVSAPTIAAPPPSGAAIPNEQPAPVDAPPTQSFPNQPSGL